MTKKVMNVSFVLFTFFYKFNFFFFGNNIQNLSRIFYVRNLSRFVYPEFVQNFSCPEFVRNLSRFICPEFVQNFYTGQILDNFWMKPNSKYCICVKKMDDFRTCKIYSGQFLDIFDDIFRTFSFYRESQ